MLRQCQWLHCCLSGQFRDLWCSELRNPCRHGCTAASSASSASAPIHHADHRLSCMWCNPHSIALPAHRAATDRAQPKGMQCNPSAPDAAQLPLALTPPASTPPASTLSHQPADKPLLLLTCHVCVVCSIVAVNHWPSPSTAKPSQPTQPSASKPSSSSLQIQANQANPCVCACHVIMRSSAPTPCR